MSSASANHCPATFNTTTGKWYTGNDLKVVMDLKNNTVPFAWTDWGIPQEMSPTFADVLAVIQTHI